MQAARILCLLALFCGLSLGLNAWTRQRPYIVESGTHIDKNSTHISFFMPSGKEEHHRLDELDTSHYGHGTTRMSKPGATVKIGQASGWVSSFWAWGNAYNYIAGSWTVPRPPTSSQSNIIFFFNSLEGKTNGGSGSDILQPVLQFNNGVAGWTMAAWYGSGNYVEATPFKVNTGDQILGIVSLVNDNWRVLCFVNGQLQSQLSVSKAAFNNGDDQNTAQWALEVYNINTCSNYPADGHLTISNITVQDQGNTIKPSFSTPSPNSNACNAGGSQSNGDLTITWDVNA